MTDPAWQKSNDEYLATALAWLRGRLAALAPDAPGQGAGWLPVHEDRKPTLIERLTGRAPRQLLPGTAYDVAADAAAAEGPEGAPEGPAALEHSASPPALVILGRRLGLSRFEREVLLLSAAMELDTRIAGLCARAHDDASKAHPTFALAMALFDDPCWDALSPERPLRFWRLIEIWQPAGQPLMASALRVDERIANYLKGVTHLDDRLASVVSALPDERSGPELPAAHAASKLQG